jgi:hypothetical protein
MGNAIIWQSRSIKNTFFFYFGNMACLGILGIILLNYEVNPPLVIGASLFLALYICGNSLQRVIVRDDRLEITSERFIPAFSTLKTLYFAEIESMEAILPLTREMANGLFSAWLSPHHANKLREENRLIIYYKDGHQKELFIKVPKEDMEQAFQHVRRLSSINIISSKAIPV